MWLVFAAASAHADEVRAVPDRTAISLRTTLGPGFGSANEHEVRSGLSLSKLFIVDYALRHGDGSALDYSLSERMIRDSDDAAAGELDARYPQAIEVTAREYGLRETHPGPDWGSATTSTADVADFLAAKQRTDPGSPIFGWMADASATAADGTEQDWGTARLPGVLGSKWGWSDFGPPEVASASFGPWFAVAAHTHGTGSDQTEDVLTAVPLIALALLRW
ncbi:hypothetical protein D5S18_22215 [Nocardia panacis]|uniref:Serine hydrolase n=2 Tax=Nocardia panacis TaxID=2340916 RepID=A0A3A4K674_9NOCA|nr:hypothetical protein D5S18_22215 [Nocardia panacis]